MSHFLFKELLQQEELTPIQIEELEQILIKARKDPDENWDQNETVSQLLNVKIEFEDVFFNGTEGYKIGHAVYKLQKNCIDLDTALLHCQALNLKQTGQFWKLLKVLKTISANEGIKNNH